MVGCYHVIENAETISLAGLEKPSDPSTAIPGEFEQEIPLVASMSDVPNTTGDMISVRPGHMRRLSLEGHFGR